MALKDVIISILSRSPKDQYSIFRQLGGKIGMSEIIKAIAEMQKEGLIHVVDYRKNERTGLDVPLYSAFPQTIKRLDLHSLLAGVTSERLVEYRFLERNLVPKIREAVVVDIGSSGSGVAEAIRQFRKRYRVLAIDLTEHDCDARMDARSLALRDRLIDQVISISTIEHIGLSCSIDDKSGDKKAMEEILRVLKRGATAIITVPYGIEGKKEYRVYNGKTLDRLVRGFAILKKELYRNDRGKWRKCNQAEADTSRADIPHGLHSSVCVCLLLKKQ